ncbi:radical SAM protein, partial [Candidatus Uhrbacteria bacterium]|nr:radical SAM protein [Candidatus Uhrbacteria bacterium]
PMLCIHERSAKVARIVLISPPASSVWHLPAGIASLAAFLETARHEVLQRYSYITAAEYVLLHNNPSLASQALRTIRSSDALIADRARASIQVEHISRSIPTIDRFAIARNNVEYGSPYYTGRIADAAAAIQDCSSNLFYEYFCKEELPALSTAAPEIVGIGISDERQFIPGLILGYLVKQGLPGVRVILGGNLFSRMRYAMQMPGFERFFQACHAIVHGEGYLPFQEIANGTPLPYVAGIAYVNAGVVQVNGIGNKPVSYNSLPTPVFPADIRQWCPDMVYPLYTRSNCPQRCGFCAISAGSDTFLTGYRSMTPERIAEHMARLGSRFDITDELFPIREQLALGKELERLGNRAEWQCYLTVTDDLLDEDVCHRLYHAGLRAVQLGLETLEVGTLHRENKRWNISRIDEMALAKKYAKILANLRSAGIQTHIFLIVGLPGESVSAGLRWLPFLQDCGENILTIKSGRYRATRHSPDEAGSRHNDWIQLSADDKPLRLNRLFTYRKGVSGKQVDALRDAVEQASRNHWAYGVTSVLPWWANRGRYSWELLQEFASQLVRSGYQPDLVEHMNTALTRLGTALKSEGYSQQFTTLEQLSSIARGL